MEQKSFPKIKAILFDMDGVLFDSMKIHAKAWVYAMNKFGIPFTEYDAYLREGMTGYGTIKEIFKERKGEIISDEICKKIYETKCDYFDSKGKTEIIPGIIEVLKTVKEAGLDIYIVTGSGQKSLIDKLNHYFPNYFSKEKMITAFDVKNGKPNPEPYLMALKKGNLEAEEAIVIENSPLGVKSGHSAGIYTIAVNTGILKDDELTKMGCNILFHNMGELNQKFSQIVNK